LFFTDFYKGSGKMTTENTVKTSAFSLTLTESKSTLRLSTDALLLSAYVREERSAKALEMGAGNGTVSMLLARRNCFASIFAVEVQSELCDIMRSNIEENGFTGKIAIVNADVRALNPEPYKGVRAVFANPPYMKCDSGASSPLSSKQIARHEVMGGIIDFCQSASKILKTGGRLYLVYRPDRLSTMFSALTECGFSPNRMTFVHSDKAHRPSSVLVEAALGGGESLTVTRPLFLNGDDGKESADCSYIYGNGVFPDDFFVR
jgi:tRNA1Val (adenine37-N6)-methyltransferase